jgi:hypothetical protein
VSPDARPDRHALLELQALLDQIAALRGEGDAARFTADARYRWILHRLWIAAGNEADYLFRRSPTLGPCPTRPGRDVPRSAAANLAMA